MHLSLGLLRSTQCPPVRGDVRIVSALSHAGTLIPSRFSEPEAIRSVAPFLEIWEFDPWDLVQATT